MFDRKYIFNPGPFPIAMLDYRSVVFQGVPRFFVVATVAGWCGFFFFTSSRC